jgi:hypothetical protein
VTYANMLTGTILGTATGTITVTAADPAGGGQGTAGTPQQPVGPIGVFEPIVVTLPIGTTPAPPAVQPIAVTTPAPVASTGRAAVPSSAASAGPALAAEFTVFLEDLQEGLFTIPFPNVASAATPQDNSAPAFDPFHPDRYWDAALALLET